MNNDHEGEVLAAIGQMSKACDRLTVGEKLFAWMKYHKEVTIECGCTCNGWHVFLRNTGGAVREIGHMTLEEAISAALDQWEDYA